MRLSCPLALRLPLLFLILVLGISPAFSAEPPVVKTFTPQGSGVRPAQVSAVFSTAMVTFGNPQARSPFSVDCPLPGAGRWIDDRQWVYDFKEPPEAGHRCAFTLRPGLASLSGKQVAGQKVFFFDTGGPRIMAFMPNPHSIEENQAFLLLPDGAVQRNSLNNRIFFEIDGVSEKVGAVLMEGPERQELLERLASRPQQDDLQFAGDVPREVRKKVKLRSATTLERLLAVTCQRPLPSGKTVHLVWDAGIATASGVVATTAQRLKFTVEEPPRGELSCERTSETADCMPITPIHINFHGSFAKSLLEKVRLVSADGKQWPAEPLRDTETAQGLTFPGPFPEKTEFRLMLPEGFLDERGRALENAATFPLKFKTAPYPPLVKFPASFGILELNAEPVLPVAMRNVEDVVQAWRIPSGGKQDGESAVPLAVQGRQRILQDDADIVSWLKTLRTNGAYGYEAPLIKETPGSEAFTVPKPGGGEAFELVGIPLPEPGLHIVELASPRLGEILFGRSGVYHVNTAALVTNMAVHLKWGEESSLVWVTALDSGLPVEGASLRITDFESGATLWEGITGKNGMAKTPAGALGEKRKPGTWEHRELMVSARKSNDLSFALSSWDEGIASHDFGFPWDFWRSYEWHLANQGLGLRSSPGDSSRLIGHTIFDRPLFRAGETVHMQHILRKAGEQGFALPPAADAFDKLLLTHQGTNQKIELPVKFSKGNALSEWKIPKGAKLGSYFVHLVKKEIQRESAGDGGDDGEGEGGGDGEDEGDAGSKNEDRLVKIPTGSFRVAEFRVPSMRGEIRLPGRDLVNPSETRLDLSVRYLSGGPAMNMPVKLRTQTKERPVFFPGYPEYFFFGGDVREGLDDERPYSGEETTDADTEKTSPAKVATALLDATGTARVNVGDLPSKPVPQTLVAEMEYEDASGETLTVADRIPIWPSGVALGFRLDEEFLDKDRIHFPVLALDTTGKPIAGQAIEVDLFRTEYHQSRKRLAGGFYAYETREETIRAGAICQGNTGESGIFFCESVAPPPGSYRVRARTVDAAGNASVTSGYLYQHGNGYHADADSGSDRMDVITTRRDYQPGETARFEVRMPFQEAQALVTVEREGVLDAFVTRLTAGNPVVEVPIKSNYGPNVYVSVLAVRGRLDAPQPTAIVDLAKPAFRLGYCRINVGWQGYGLDVRVSSAREVYKTREKAEVRVLVQRPDGGPPPPGTEVTVAAVDEGLLELAPNRSWKLLESLMQPREIQVETATAQMQVVGKRHYGRKAIPSGGGGGRQPSRELFDTLLLWQSGVRLDANGEATILVPLNDALTSFRIAALAVHENAFGSGFLSIRATQDVMLHSGLPSVVRAGDRFQATATVRNGADKPLALTVRATMQPLLGDAAQPSETLPETSVQLAPGEARELSWPAVVPGNTDLLRWTITADTAAAPGAQPARDELKISQTVRDPAPIATLQRTLLRLDKDASLPVVRPPDAQPDKGGVEVTLSPQLVASRAEMDAWMREYPYSCLEQRISRAVALKDAAAWEKITGELSAYTDRDGLLRFFPTEVMKGSPVLTAYLLAVSHEAGFKLPEGDSKKLVDGLIRFLDGKTPREGWYFEEDKLHLVKLMAISALSRYPGAAKPAMLFSFAFSPKTLPLAALPDWIGILRRLDGVEKRDKLLTEALDALRAKLYASGSTISLSSDGGLSAWWLLSSPDAIAVRLILETMDQPDFREQLPKFMLGAVSQQKKGRWDTTMANAWGRIALARFSERFEKTKVAGETLVSLEKLTNRLDWQKQTKGGTFTLPWPGGEGSLRLSHSGDGAPWAAVASRAALPLEGTRESGYTITRTVTPVEQATPGAWSRGDVARVRIALTAKTGMGWVVVADPLPAGATVIGRGLARDSALLAAGEKAEGLRPAFSEAGEEWYRAYYQWAPAGSWTMEYTLRLNASGAFLLPPTRVEAMYVPELFAEQANAAVTVVERPGSGKE